MELKASPSHAYVGTETTHKNHEMKYTHEIQAKYILFNLRLDGLYGRSSPGDHPSQASRTDKCPTFYNMRTPPTTFRRKPSFSIPPALSDRSSLVWTPGRAHFSHCRLPLKASRAALSPMFSIWPQRQALKTSYYLLKHCSYSRNFCFPGSEKVHRENKKKEV